MSWLLFLDESGHDHKHAPYEVRGGIALHAGEIWSFVQDMKALEMVCFGDALHNYRTEIKGHRLLDKERREWSGQGPPLDEAARQKLCRSFLNKGVEKKSPTLHEFTAYGQACMKLAAELFPLLQAHGAVLFASAIPRSVKKPTTSRAEEYLRKDQVFLLERFFSFLELKKEHGLLVFDETDKTDDRRFVRRVESYFTKTVPGRQWTQWIVPSPLFVSSDMTYPVQAADVCIYCINWGYRLPRHGMTAPTRPEIERDFSHWLRDLQFEGDCIRWGKTVHRYGITYVADPYGREAELGES